MDFAEQVKSSVDIVRVVGEYVRLRKSSSTRYTGLCPFHNEKTPSFGVHAARQFYKCFGCGAAGDVFKFVMEIEQISFYEALKLLAERNGIPMPKRSEYSDPDTRKRASVFQMNEMAEEAFRNHLSGPAGAEARSYLARRGVSAEAIGQFGLGYSDRSGRFLTKLFDQQGFSAEQLENSGLVSRRQDGSFFDRFRNRLMFPIHNETGKIIGFGGRALAAEDEPKYLNSPETPIYRKSYVLYNLHRAKEAVRKSGRVVLVEGYMDAIGVWSVGVREVVATCGTALTSQQVMMMKRHADRILVNFDPDAAGANAAERSLNLLLDEGMHVRIVELEGGLDPDEYCKENGAEAYRRRLEEAKGYFYWLADRGRGKFDMRTAEGRVAAFQFLMPAVQRIPEKLERVALVNDLAAYLGVEPGLVLEQFRKTAADRKEIAARPAAEPLPAVERILLNLLVANPEARDELIPLLRGLPALEQFRTRRIFEALFTLHDARARIDYEDVHARLEEADRDVLADTVLRHETETAAVSLEQGIACLRTLENRDRQGQRSALKARIRDAERAGKLDEALRLAQELTAFESGSG